MAFSLKWAHLFLLVLAAERLIELIIARQNENRVKAMGGKEFDAQFTKLLVSFHVLWFLSFAAEGYISSKGFVAAAPLIFLFLALFQAWRYWCIVSLEGFWNTKVIVLPGADLKRRGPYRFISHPNYIVVLLELYLYPALFGCFITSAIFGTLNIFILKRRIDAENSALALMHG